MDRDGDDTRDLIPPDEVLQQIANDKDSLERGDLDPNTFYEKYAEGMGNLEQAGLLGIPEVTSYLQYPLLACLAQFSFGGLSTDPNKDSKIRHLVSLAEKMGMDKGDDEIGNAIRIVRDNLPTDDSSDFKIIPETSQQKKARGKAVEARLGVTNQLMRIIMNHSQDEILGDNELRDQVDKLVPEVIAGMAQEDTEAAVRFLLQLYPGIRQREYGAIYQKLPKYKKDEFVRTYNRLLMQPQSIGRAGYMYKDVQIATSQQDIEDEAYFRYRKPFSPDYRRPLEKAQATPLGPQHQFQPGFGKRVDRYDSSGSQSRELEQRLRNQADVIARGNYDRSPSRSPRPASRPPQEPDRANDEAEIEIVKIGPPFERFSTEEVMSMIPPENLQPPVPLTEALSSITIDDIRRVNNGPLWGYHLEDEDLPAYLGLINSSSELQGMKAVALNEIAPTRLELILEDGTVLVITNKDYDNFDQSWGKRNIDRPILGQGFLRNPASAKGVKWIHTEYIKDVPESDENQVAIDQFVQELFEAGIYVESDAYFNFGRDRIGQLKVKDWISASSTQSWEEAQRAYDLSLSWKEFNVCRHNEIYTDYDQGNYQDMELRKAQEIVEILGEEKFKGWYGEEVWNWYQEKSKEGPQPEN